jgi:cyclophilin family peptidyl-prolyl cis-trans isomerase
MKRVVLFCVVLFLLTLVVGCRLLSQKETEEPKKTTQAVTTETSEGQEPSKTPSDEVISGAKVAILETNKGKIIIKFFPEKAPHTVENFIKLAKSGFYDGVKFHRVEPGFVIQGGDPLSKDDDPSNDGMGGPGYTVKAEFNDLSHVTGTVAMARRAYDPDSAGSQFYICLAPQPQLDGQYTIFGQVVDGVDVVQKIEVGDVIKKITLADLGDIGCD